MSCSDIMQLPHVCTCACQGRLSSHRFPLFISSPVPYLVNIIVRNASLNHDETSPPLSFLPLLCLGVITCSLLKFMMDFVCLLNLCVMHYRHISKNICSMLCVLRLFNGLLVLYQGLSLRYVTIASIFHLFSI